MDPSYSPRPQSSHRHTLSDPHAPGPNGFNHGHPPMPLPGGPQALRGANGMNSMGRSNRRSMINDDGGLSRSPPLPAQSKNTAHVPCKFFKVGNCQAGSACPFSHMSPDSNEQQPCKFFAKANCKFGSKCANPHLLPDGRDARKIRGPYGGGYNYSSYQNVYPNGGFQSGFNPMQALGAPQPQSTYSSPIPIQEEYFPQQQQMRAFEPLPTNEQVYSNQQYGSPPNDYSLAMSPPARALDTVLPASFDDRGMSMLTRDGPVAASAPKRFGFGPLSATSTTTSMAASNAFGNLSYLAGGNTPNGNRNSLLGSSPSAIEDAFPRKILHSDLRPAHPMYASSFQGPYLVTPSPPLPEDSSSERSSEELTRLPGALDDLLTPKERVRRFSRPAEDSDGGLRPRSLSGFGSPSPNSPVGSPSNGSPSSRYGALFARRQRVEDTGNELGSSAPGASVFGHVGSPLRQTSLQGNSTSASNFKPSSISRTRSGNDSSIFQSSSPGSGSGGMGMLSQQFRASGLSNGLSASQDAADTRGSVSRGLSVPSALSSQRLDRTISTSSMGRGVEDQIKEEDIEDDDGMFEMDGIEADRKAKASSAVRNVDNVDKKELVDTSEELTPTTTGNGNHEMKTATRAGTQPKKSEPQPPAQAWSGGSRAWNVVAAAGSRMGLMSSSKQA